MRDDKDPGEPLELVLPDQTRLALIDELTIGRGPESTLRLSDPSVSRLHARISPGAGGAAVLADAGSSYGTWLDGRRVVAPTRLRMGARIRVGNQELVVDRRRGDNDSGRTLVVPPVATAATRFGGHPHVRSGYALKRLEAREGDRRWVLKDLRSGRLVRLSEADAELFRLIDGERSLAELVGEAERRMGATGGARLMVLLASLGERGFLAGADETTDGSAGDRRPGGLTAARSARLARLLAPRNLAWSGAGALGDRLYRDGGWLLFTRPAASVLAAVAVAGLAAFAALVAGRYGTPFVVASKFGLGGIVFLLGRLAVAAVHETAHGLAMASLGRGVREAGLKRVLIFPYVYVDTSDAWFEPRRRRILVSAAGPASDVCLAGTFSLVCLALPASGVRDVFFQLAFGAYIAAFFNLNPLVERDGYQILVDLLRQPGLRRRAREQLRRRMAGDRRASDSALLTRYAAFGLGWSVVGAGIAVAMSLHYRQAFERLAPEPLVWVVMVAVWVVILLPVLAVVPTLVRRRPFAPSLVRPRRRR